jgi:hypothetical protein
MRAFVVARKYITASNTNKSIEERVRALEEANEELLKDMNDLSEDTRKSFDDLFEAFAKLSNKIALSDRDPNPNETRSVLPPRNTAKRNHHNKQACRK